MNFKIQLGLACLTCILGLATSQFAYSPQAPIPPPPPQPQRQQPLTAQGGFRTEGNLYTLLWEVRGNVITFKAKVRGTGFVGFGISPYGGMQGADVYMAGIHSNGTAYAFDAKERNGNAEIDPIQDYSLQYAADDSTSTEIHFSRFLDTGDVQDLPIRNQTQFIIWSIGPPGDNFAYHGASNRGVIRVNLLNQVASGTFVYIPGSNYV